MSPPLGFVYFFPCPPPQLGSPLPVNTGSILDDYEICEGTIGYGSYSTCKRCIHRATGVDYAVKVGHHMTHDSSHDCHMTLTRFLTTHVMPHMTNMIAHMIWRMILT